MEKKLTFKSTNKIFALYDLVKTSEKRRMSKKQ